MTPRAIRHGGSGSGVRTLERCEGGETLRAHRGEGRGIGPQGQGRKREDGTRAMLRGMGEDGRGGVGGADREGDGNGCATLPDATLPVAVGQDRTDPRRVGGAGVEGEGRVRPPGPCDGEGRGDGRGAGRGVRRGAGGVDCLAGVEPLRECGGGAGVRAADGKDGRRDGGGGAGGGGGVRCHGVFILSWVGWGCGVRSGSYAAGVGGGGGMRAGCAHPLTPR